MGRLLFSSIVLICRSCSFGGSSVFDLSMWVDIVVGSYLVSVFVGCRLCFCSFGSSLYFAYHSQRVGFLCCIFGTLGCLFHGLYFCRFSVANLDLFGFGTDRGRGYAVYRFYSFLDAAFHIGCIVLVGA